jgi:rubrerythrin
MMEIIILIVLFIILYLEIKSSIGHSKTAQNIQEIKQYLHINSEDQKVESSLEVNDSGYESCPACNFELASNETTCPSCGLFLGP